MLGLQIPSINVSIFHLKNMFLSLPKVNFTKLTDLEKKKATDTFVINNYTNNFYYETSDVNIQQ